MTMIPKRKVRDMAKTIRKKYVIKKDLQLRILLETALLMFFVAVLVGCSVYLGGFKALLFELSGEKITLVNRVISLRMFMWFLPAVLAIIIISVFLSHRIAGPIFHFQRTIKEMMKGQPVPEIHLRKHDRFKDFAEDLNGLIEYVNRVHPAETGKE